MTFLKSNRRKNEFLTVLFSEEEIWDAVFQMEHNKALGRMPFPLSIINFSRTWSRWNCYSWKLGLLSGMCCADPKARVVWAFGMIKTLHFSVNDYINSLLRTTCCGSWSFVTSRWDPKTSLSLVGNRLTPFFGVAWWRPMNKFSNLTLSRSGMVPKLNSGKIPGLGPLPLRCNTVLNWWT